MSTQKTAFELQTLTASINNVPFKPYRLGALGLFEEQGINTTTAQIERLNGAIGLVATAPRGAPGQVVIGDKRTVIALNVPHIPVAGGLDADELQGIRAFGQESGADNVTAARDRLLAKMRSSLEMTIEAHRVGALQGLVLDKDGSTLLDLFSAFGVAQQSEALTLASSTTVRKSISQAIVKVETALGGTPYGSLRAICGTAFFDALLANSSVEKFWLNQIGATGFAQSNPTQAIEFGGVIWERYRGVTGGMIATGEAYLVPEGVPGLFITRYAPANYIETVNTLGLPMYARAEVRDMNKGYDLEAQTNPLNLCTRPNAVIKLTQA